METGKELKQRRGEWGRKGGEPNWALRADRNSSWLGFPFSAANTHLLSIMGCVQDLLYCLAAETVMLVGDLSDELGTFSPHISAKISFLKLVHLQSLPWNISFSLFQAFATLAPGADYPVRT